MMAYSIWVSRLRWETLWLGFFPTGNHTCLSTGSTQPTQSPDAKHKCNAKNMLTPDQFHICICLLNNLLYCRFIPSIKAFALLGRLSNRFWTMFVEICVHLAIKALVRSGTNFRLALNSVLCFLTTHGKPCHYELYFTSAQRHWNEFGALRFLQRQLYKAASY